MAAAEQQRPAGCNVNLETRVENQADCKEGNEQSELLYDHNRNLLPAEVNFDKEVEAQRKGLISSNHKSTSHVNYCEAELDSFGVQEVGASGRQSSCESSSDCQTNQTSCSTRRMSQTSFANTIHHQSCESDSNNEHPRQLLHLEETTSSTEGSSGSRFNQQQQCNSIDGDTYEESELAAFVDLTQAVEHDQIVIRMHDGGADSYIDEVLRRPSLKPQFGFGGAQAPDSDLKLVKLLSRRVSALPQLFSLARSPTLGGPTGTQINRCIGPLGKDDELLSPARQPLTEDMGIPKRELDRRYTLHETPYSNCSSLPTHVEGPSPTSVVGVGGTITTVTRGHRKTAPLPRLVAKNGNVNLFLDNIDRRQFMRDLFTTMIDIKWRYNLLAASLGFVFSWFLFACIWYMVLYVHGDLLHENDPNWSPCIVNVHSFPAALLFSIETQSTLGFGSRIISVECPGAIVIFCIQLIFGVVVECLIVGMVFAKLSRPAKRSQTIMFSKNATICLREGQMCLNFRVGDVRSKSHIIGATIRASLVSQKITQEGETIPFYHHQLDVKIDDSFNCLLLIWPVIIVHHIDEHSPFYNLNPEELANFKFEIITVLEGTVESTGQSIQVRSSYLPSEVKWGYRFEPIVSTHGNGRYAQTIIDYNKFNKLTEVDTPRCSPRDYYHRRQSICDENSGLNSKLH